MYFTQKNIIIGIIAFIFLVVIVALLPENKPINKGSNPSVTPSERHIILGAWTQGFFDPDTKTLHPEKLTQFEKMINKRVAIAHFYIGWESLADPDLIKQFATIRSRGWEPMLNVNPYFFSDCSAADLPLYQAIAQGKCDDFLHKAGKNLKNVNEPFYLLFAWEMNNKDNEWSIPYTGSSPKDFVSAWRRMHTIFAKEGATTIKWVFAPNVPDVADVPYEALYPGDKYVDWVGLDGYNWGMTQSWSQWASFEGVFRSSYETLTRIAPDKPLMISEVNSTDQGGNKAAWYQEALTKQIPYDFPKIKAIVIFNEDKSEKEHVNWLVDVTPQTLEAFISAIHSPFY
jgi:beta-mannanase